MLRLPLPLHHYELKRLHPSEIVGEGDDESPWQAGSQEDEFVGLAAIQRGIVRLRGISNREGTVAVQVPREP